MYLFLITIDFVSAHHLIFSCFALFLLTEHKICFYFSFHLNKNLNWIEKTIISYNVRIYFVITLHPTKRSEKKAATATNFCSGSTNMHFDKFFFLASFGLVRMIDFWTLQFWSVDARVFYFARMKMESMTISDANEKRKWIKPHCRQIWQIKKISI